MIKALIVDDEYMVRKGMIHTIKWNKFAIEIIGEADSAQKALDFILENEVDLLLTDITMPDISGFELIEKVIKDYPEIFVVVVTCHHEFEFVQKAMRMGAIDYIVKTELEDEELEESLARISVHINTATQNKEKMKNLLNSGTKDFNYGLALIPRYNAFNASEIICLMQLQKEEKIDMGNGTMFYLIDENKIGEYKKRFLCINDTTDWIVLGVKNVAKLGREKLSEHIEGYINNYLMYNYGGSSCYYDFDATDDEYVLQLCESNKLFQLKKEWSNVLWISNDDEYNRLKTATKIIRPDIMRLKSIFYKLIAEWEACLAITIHEEYYEKLELVRFWIDFEKWTYDLRSFAGRNFNKSSYPDETVNIIFNSLDYLRMNFSKDLKQENIAKIFNLSRSYFSKAFKDIVGVNFTEYMRNIRLEKAKIMLIQTNTMVYKIAEEVGFEDEKYFSRIFKENTCMTPYEYRNQKGNS